MAKIPYHKIEKFSGKRAILVKGVPVVKRCNYVIVQGVSVTGDAPKVIVRIHDGKKEGIISNGTNTGGAYISPRPDINGIRWSH